MKEKLRGIPQQGIGYGLLRYLAGGERSATLSSGPQTNVSFNYLGQVDRGFAEQSRLLRAAPESRGDEWAPDTTRTHVLDVIGRISAGRLQIVLHYSENLHDRTAIEELADAFVASLQELVP